MKYASDILEEEHRLIERMLEVLVKAIQKLEEGEAIPAELFLKAVDFIRHFADQCHHAKEENVLFKLMEERGIPREGGPVGVMLTEHVFGRNYNKGLEEAAHRYQKGEVEAKSDIIKYAQNYVELLSQHIHKEDNILYPMGNRVFSEEDQNFLLEEFERVEKEEIGAGVHEKYKRMVEELEAAVA
ncbi:MAG: hemerythrin domain-containing protein [Calditrichia bacterium]